MKNGLLEKRGYRRLVMAAALLCMTGALTACQAGTGRSKEVVEKMVDALASAVKKDKDTDQEEIQNTEVAEEGSTQAGQSEASGDEAAATEEGRDREEGDKEQTKGEAGTDRAAEGEADKETERSAEKTQEERLEEAVRAVQPEMEIYIEKHSFGYQEGDTVLTDENYESIRIEGEKYGGLARALETYRLECEADAVSWRNNDLEAVRAIYERDGTYRQPLVFKRELSVKRADAQVFSVLVDDVWWSIGDVEQADYGRNFDSRTGRVLSLEDVMVVDQHFLDVLLKEFYEQRPEESPHIWYIDDPDTLILRQFEPGQPREERPRWVLGNNGISFYFDSQMLLDGLMTIEVLLPFEQYPELFRAPYRKGPEEFAQEIEEGEAVRFDIDHDGRLEEISMNGWDLLEYEHLIRIYIDGEERCTQAYPYGFLGRNYLLKNSDGEYYLYLETAEVDEVSHILVFDLNRGDPVYKGDCFGWFSGGLVTKPSCFHLGKRIAALGYQYAYRPFYMGEGGLPEPFGEIYTIPQGIMYDGQGHEEAWWATTKRPVPAQQILEDGTMEVGQIPAGVRCYPYRTDERSFVDVESEDGRRFRLQYDAEVWPHTIQGIDEDSYFDGLVYAG